MKFLNNIFFNKDLKKKEQHAVDTFISELLDKGYINPSSRNIIDLDYWESLNTSSKIIPGCIYVMLYESEKFTISMEYETNKKMNEFVNGKSKIQKKLLLSADKYLFQFLQYIKSNSFYEVIPTVLVRKLFTGEHGEKYIHGINLNYCSKDVKKAVLEEVYKIDPNYFDKEIYEIVSSGSWHASEKIAKTVMQDAWLKMLINKLGIKNVDLLSRTYKCSSIKKIRFVDLWMYNYIPFLNYKDCVDEKNLRTIQKLLLSSKMPYYKLPEDIKL